MRGKSGRSWRHVHLRTQPPILWAESKQSTGKRDSQPLCRSDPKYPDHTEASPLPPLREGARDSKSPGVCPAQPSPPGTPLRGQWILSGEDSPTSSRST